MNPKVVTGIQLAILAALISIVINERANVLKQIEQNTLQIAVNAELLRSFQDYPRNAADFRFIIMSSVKDALNPQLIDLDKRLNALERKVDNLQR